MKDDDEPLLRSYHAADPEQNPGHPPIWRRNFRSIMYTKMHLWASVFWFGGSLVMLIVVLVSNRPIAYDAPEASLIYSPAQDRVTYKRVVFPAFHDKSPYQAEPSPEVDSLWTDLYNFGISWITSSEASRLPNQTSQIPGTDEERYIIGLDVFHQLHCLNMLRKALNPQYYDNQEGESAMQMHSGHCIEHLRQAIMCNADISTVYWTWNEKKQRTLADAQVTHVCRDFDAIKEWGMERQVKEAFDPSVYIEGNPIFKEGD